MVAALSKYRENVPMSHGTYLFCCYQYDWLKQDLKQWPLAWQLIGPNFPKFYCYRHGRKISWSLNYIWLCWHNYSWKMSWCIVNNIQRSYSLKQWSLACCRLVQIPCFVANKSAGKCPDNLLKYLVLILQTWLKKCPGVSLKVSPGSALINVKLLTKTFVSRLAVLHMVL